jgi:hypothetical protein
LFKKNTFYLSNETKRRRKEYQLHCQVQVHCPAQYEMKQAPILDDFPVCWSSPSKQDGTDEIHELCADHQGNKYQFVENSEHKFSEPI